MIVELCRLVFLNHEHEITGTAKVHCDSDEQAIAEARTRADGRRFVVWRSNRLVGIFEDFGD
jgi:hypothetical protein